jgi:hypothetical protein
VGKSHLAFSTALCVLGVKETISTQSVAEIRRENAEKASQLLDSNLRRGGK